LASPALVVGFLLLLLLTLELLLESPAEMLSVQVVLLVPQ
jgi:hypothetical protein